MGGIFGKNKRLCVFPMRVIYKAKGKKTSRTTHMFCDVSTWTGENHFHSARIGRTRKSPEPSAAKLVLDTPESAAQAKQDTGEQAAPLHAQHTEASLSVPAGDTQDAEVLQDPEAQPSTEVMQHQELAEETEEAAAQPARRSRQGSSKTEAVLHPTGSCVSKEQLGCKDHDVTPLTRTTVKAEVHVSADAQGGPDKVHSAIVESELLTGAEQEAGVVCASEETCVGKTPQEVPVQKAADSPPALCTTGSELPLKAIETREGVTNVQRSADEQAVEEKVCGAAEAPHDLQLEQDTEVPVTEDMEENGFEPEQAEEMPEVCDDGQTSKEVPCCLTEAQAALQGKERIEASNGEKPEEH